MRRALFSQSIVCASVLSGLVLIGSTPVQAAFPGFNGKIAFERGSTPDIWVMDPSGANPQNLTNSPSAIDADPAFSADGTKIVFDTNRNGSREIYVMNADGTGQTRLTTSSTGKGDFNPSFSPDGSKIVFASLRDGNLEIYLMNADGTAQSRLTTHPRVDTTPVFSPDGTKITFNSDRDPDPMSVKASDFEIYTMNADGTGLTQITNNSVVPKCGVSGSNCRFDGAQDLKPDYSPDGSQIAFFSDRDLNPEIYVMNANGTGQTRLTTDAADDLLPSFSPDGTKITYTSDRDGDLEVFVMNANGSAQAQVTANTARDARPNWGKLLARAGSFSCRASALTLDGLPQPVVANPPDSPCVDDSESLANAGLSVGSGTTQVQVDAGLLAASTDQTPDNLNATPPAVGDNGAANADATTVSITVGTGLTAVVITADLLHAEAKVNCSAVGIPPTLTSASSVANVSVTVGVLPAVVLIAGTSSATASIAIPALGTSLDVNGVATTANSVTRRALSITALGVPVVISEAKADFSGNPCAN